MKYHKLLTLAVATSALFGCNHSENEVVKDTTSFNQPGGVMYFFENGMPSTVSHSIKSSAVISDAHRKDGIYSLAWNAAANAELIFNQDVGFKPFVANDEDQSQSTFTTWVYNESAQDNTLRFTFSTDEVEQTWFDINLDFTGWRELIIPFSDMEGKAVSGMNRLAVKAPTTLADTTFYFDQMMLSIPVDPRWPTRDNVVPFVNLKADVAPNRHWLSLYRYYNFLNEADVSLADAPLDTSAVDSIFAKLDSFGGQGKGKTKPMNIAEVKAAYLQYELVEKNGFITGKPLDNTNRQKIFLDKGVNKGLLDEDGFKHVFDVMDMRDYGGLMFNIAKNLQKEISTEDRQALENMYIKLTRYALDQGYEAGSAVGTSHHMGYTLRALFQAHYLNRDLLAKHDLSADVSNMIAWFAGTGRIYRPVSEMTSFNVDVMNTQLRGMLYSILMQPNLAKQAAWLEQFSFWISRSINNSNGLSGGFKQDGSIFHHAQHYPAYGKGALQGITPVLEALSHTPYAVNQQAHETIKKAVLMSEMYSNNAFTFMSVAGRHPDGNQKIATSPFMFMARAGSPDGKQAIDADIASAYLRLAPEGDKFSNYLLSQGMTQQPIAEGNWPMNLASLSIQRREGWVASMRGFSRYLVGNESYANANRYGRYINYGQLEILNTDATKSRAFSHDGWDWNRWPGTTAVQLPFSELQAKLRNVDSFSGLEEMLMSEQTYAGALSDGRNGMYAMKLQGHPKYDASFYANKSVFFFDDRIIALGSDIRSTDRQHPVQTTLLQHALRGKADELELNGKAVAKGNQVVSSDTSTVLMDPNNNAYIVPKSTPMIVNVGDQDSFHQKNSKPTTGRFASAVIDHGNAPTSGRYEYAVLVNSTFDEANTFAKTLNQPLEAAYRVEQQDSDAHIVVDKASHTRAYAFFNPTSLANDQLIVDIDSAAMVMASAVSDHLTLNIVNPDLNLYQGKDESQYDEKGVQKEVSIYSRQWKDNQSKAITTKLTLKGRWGSESALPAGVTLTLNENGTTSINVMTIRAESQKIELVRK